MFLGCSVDVGYGPVRAGAVSFLISRAFISVEIFMCLIYIARTVIFSLNKQLSRVGRYVIHGR